MKINKISFFILSTLLMLMVAYILAVSSLFTSPHGAALPLELTMVSAAFLLSFQGIFTLFWMLYGWEDPEKMIIDGPPRELVPAQKTFTLLVPARLESAVIAGTIRSLFDLIYPLHMFEVLILCKDDDIDTIAEARKTIQELHAKNIKVLIFSSEETNKPSALNIGLAAAKHEIVGVFDAEDEPDARILHYVNSVFVKEKPDVIQGGVQLMNYDTAWFSPLNVLEYYFWYKSALHLFSRMEVVPLGGNTVFFDKKTLKAAGGWHSSLTEDAEVGLRLSSLGKKIKIMYHPGLVTAEESPSSLTALLKQRTRWNQGFFELLLQKKWAAFPELKRKLFALYFLMLAQINALNFLLILISALTLFVRLPVMATLVVMFPLYLLLLQLLTQLLGYIEFTKDFKKKFSILVCVKIVVGFLPYQFILAFAAFRSISRHIQGQNNWEKTLHQNLHRAVVT